MCWPCAGAATDRAGRVAAPGRPAHPPGQTELLAVLSTPSSAPLIAATRLRKGGANSDRGAHRFVSDALITAKRAGAGGTLVLRADSAYYGHDVIAPALRQCACLAS